MYTHNVLYLIATGGYSGKIPFAPGTFGTLVGVGIVYATGEFSIFVRMMIFTLLFIVGIIAAEYHERHSGVEDSSEVVIDEIAGYFLVMLFFECRLSSLIATFILFRVFDITKPWPIKRLERIGGGTGVMVDDIAAGIYSILVFMAVRSVV
jgi:phosphatidylglycerophosphatase A